MEWGRQQAEFWLGVLNDHWLGGGNSYLCGKDMTIADYFGAGLVTAGDIVGVNYGKFPNVNAWLGRMKALPSWAGVSDVHDGFVKSLEGKSFVTIA